MGGHWGHCQKDLSLRSAGVQDSGGAQCKCVLCLYIPPLPATPSSMGGAYLLCLLLSLPPCCLHVHVHVPIPGGPWCYHHPSLPLILVVIHCPLLFQVLIIENEVISGFCFQLRYHGRNSTLTLWQMPSHDYLAIVVCTTSGN